MTTTDTTPTEAESKARDKAIRAAYQTATTTLRENHREEFVELQKETLAEQGIDWAPRPTKDEKAAEALATLLKENPSLADRLTAEVREKLAAEQAVATPGYTTGPESVAQ